MINSISKSVLKLTCINLVLANYINKHLMLYLEKSVTVGSVEATPAAAASVESLEEPMSWDSSASEVHEHERTLIVTGASGSARDVEAECFSALEKARVGIGLRKSSQDFLLGILKMKNSISKSVLKLTFINLVL